MFVPYSLCLTLHFHNSLFTVSVIPSARTARKSRAIRKLRQTQLSSKNSTNHVTPDIRSSTSENLPHFVDVVDSTVPHFADPVPDVSTVPHFADVVDTSVPHFANKVDSTTPYFGDKETSLSSNSLKTTTSIPSESIVKCLMFPILIRCLLRPGWLRLFDIQILIDIIFYNNSGNSSCYGGVSRHLKVTNDVRKESESNNKIFLNLNAGGMLGGYIWYQILGSGPAAESMQMLNFSAVVTTLAIFIYQIVFLSRQGRSQLALEANSCPMFIYKINRLGLITDKKELFIKFI